MAGEINILALDIATKTGWATRFSSGVWNFKTKSDESGGMKLIRLRSKLQEIFKVEEISLVVFERAAGFHANSVKHQARLQGIVEITCQDHSIEYRSYSASEIKKHASGKGNANKDKMVELAKDKWPDITIIDDNHSDALWLLDLAEKDVN
ncbi:MAG: crossover junction endodeoxyribonuclease RuvC [Candidatus Anammoxibacter sp.]